MVTLITVKLQLSVDVADTVTLEQLDCITNKLEEVVSEKLGAELLGLNPTRVSFDNTARPIPVD